MNALSTIPTRDQWGPWRPDLEPGERLARTRCLRAITRLIAGPRGIVLADRLRQAEKDEAALVPALAALEALAPVDRRRILASYAALT